MNRTFKVVFNRARACLVVANEITRSVQKKGTKTILVASAVAAASMPAFAASSLVGKTWNGEWDASTDSNITLEVNGSYSDVRGIDIQSGATGSVENLNLKIDDKTESGTGTTVYGVYSDVGAGESGPSFSGESFSVGVSSNFNANVYGISATKGISISANTVSISSKSSATASNKMAYGVYIKGVSNSSIASTIGKEGATVAIASEGIGTQYGTTWYYGAKGIALGDKNVTNATNSLTIEGKTITVTSSHRAVQASYGSTLSLGTDATEEITIKSEKEIGVFASASNSKIEINGQELTVNINNDSYGGIWVQNNSQNAEVPENAATISINTKKTTVTANKGLIAFSNGRININSDLTVTAGTYAIDVRGNSSVNINTDGNHQTQLTGDIVFETPNTPADPQHSGNLINAYVTANIKGENSFWEGRSYQTYKENNEAKVLVNLQDTTNYYGNVTGFSLTFSEGAKWTLTGDSFINNLMLSDGGIVDASKAKVLNVGKLNTTTSSIESGFTVSGTGNQLILGDDTALLQQATVTSDLTEITLATITMAQDSELVTSLATAFTVTETDNVVTDATNRFNVALATDATQATLTIPTSFTVTAEALTTMNEAYKEVTLNLENVAVKFESESDKKTTVYTDIITKSITGQGDLAINSRKTLTISGEEESDIGSIELGVVETGETGSSTLKVANQANVKVTELTGKGVVLVGEYEGEGATLSVGMLSMSGGAIFVDPADGFHSTFFVESLGTDNTLDTNITVGNRGLVVFGSATESEANAAIDSLVGLSSESTSAVVYTTKAAVFGESGSVVIDPSARAAVETYARKLVVRNGGTLVIDQAALNGATVFENATNVVVAGAANFGVVNAAIGQIPLVTGTTDETDAVTVETEATISVYTDSPFLTATLANDTGIITIAGSSDSEGQAVISSLGIQSMIRRADMILAETIADRAAEMELGSNLWVMVRGERYEQDGLDDGAGFHANMGYGAFGAEFAPNEKTNIGLAFQYGHGTVKGDVGSAKNKTKDYSATLYGSALIGDTGIKLLGEVAYTQSSNDITNSYYTGLNQDLDAKMISGGVTLLKRFDFDSFSLTPSIGARVSKIKTDAMKMGLNKLDKQSQTIVQVPIALRLAGKTAQTENGWSVTPRFKVAYIPTFGDKEIDIYGVEKTVLDTSPVQGAFGIKFQKGGFSIDATANAGVGNRGTSAIGGKLEMNYRF